MDFGLLDGFSENRGFLLESIRGSTISAEMHFPESTRVGHVMLTWIRHVGYSGM